MVGRVQTIIVIVMVVRLIRVKCDKVLVWFEARFYPLLLLVMNHLINFLR